MKWSEAEQPRSTFRANRLALDKLRFYAGDSCQIDRISLKHVDQMAADARLKGLSAASTNNYIRHMRCSLNKAVEWGFLKENPLREAKERRTEKKPPSFMSKEDVGRFLASIEDIDLRRLATAYLCTGRRRSELLNLTWEGVDLERGRYLVKRSKNHLSRWYPLNQMFRAVLLSIDRKERRSGQDRRIFDRWSHGDTLSHLVKKALSRSGMEHMRLHDLRHSFASIQVMQGRTLKEVQELLGHTQMATTMIYAHLSDEHLSGAAEIEFGPVDLGFKKASSHPAGTECDGQKTDSHF